ncbi:hypothetical protein SDC9_193975 [bioreactor metagenome]|uniref:Uncharacterized protein n=1 Tax=bioreactor metagenome TaxID=1076179 RepID=A0A645I7M7_9ZZZZ
MLTPVLGFGTGLDPKPRQGQRFGLPGPHTNGKEQKQCNRAYQAARRTYVQALSRNHINAKNMVDGRPFNPLALFASAKASAASS